MTRRRAVAHVHDDFAGAGDGPRHVIEYEAFGPAGAHAEQGLHALLDTGSRESFLRLVSAGFGGIHIGSGWNTRVSGAVT